MMKYGLTATVKQNQTGSVLVTVLVLLVLVSLGVGMGLMINSSSIQTAENNIELRATNLAESGFRYAAGEYVNAGSLSNKFDRLESMHQEEVTLLNNDGSFQLSVFPYWFITNATVTNATSLNLRVAGKFPKGFQADLPTTGRVNINGDFYTYNSGSATPGGTDFDPDQFSISLTGGDTISTDKNTGVYLAFAPSGTPSISEGGDFTIFSDSSFLDLLPERNGLIELYLDEVTASGTYKYSRRRVLSNGSVQLTGIESVKNGALPITLGANSRIVVKKQIMIDSVAGIGTGNLRSTRGLSLNVYLTDEEFVAADTPEELPLTGNNPQEIFDDEDTTVLDNWEFDNTGGTPEEDLITSTTQEVSTDFDIDGVPTANFLTFQNFSEEDQDQGYTMELIDKSRIPATVRDKNLNGIWGNASDNMYFVGDDGTILHFDGVDIILETIGFSVTQDLNAIWGLPSEKYSASTTDYIFVAGDDGMALINEGSGWVRAQHSETYDIYAAHGTSWGHFDGYGEAGTNPYNWDSPNTADRLSNYNWYINEFNRRINFRCLWAIDHRYPHSKNYGGGASIRDNQNVMVGEFSSSGGSGNGRWNAGDGLIFHEFYQSAVRIPGTPLRGIWGSDWANIYAVGDNGSIYRNTHGDAYNYGYGLVRPGIGWSIYHTYPASWQGGWTKQTGVPTTKNLNGVYGNSATDFYVIGDDGTILYNKGNGFELVPTNGVTSEDLNSIWGSDRTGIYAVGDNGTIVFLGYPVNKIGGHILPLDKNTEIAAKWAATQNYLSYTIQVKNVWGDDLEYAAPGICFRWHQSSVAGKYEGYGISFMRFDPSTNAYNDMIPDAIKPFFNGVKEQDDKLLIVLWEQYVQGGVEQRRWIAYKDISTDAKMVKANGTPVDLSSLTVRVHEKKIEGRRVNDINVYYGNANMSGNGGGDSVYNNTKRKRYNATFGLLKNSSIRWPTFDLIDDPWRRQIDWWTLVDNVSVALNPVPATTALKYWIVNPSSDLVLLQNGFTIRTSRFTSPSSGSFGTQSQRSEIGLHVFGDIGDNGSQRLISFTDFAVQLGVDADAVNTDSSFGSLE